MAMSGGSAPPPAPDPVATAAAQTQMNKETAIAQANLGHVNQITPDGSLTYEQIGTNADGTPRYQATTSLSGANQNIYNTDLVTKQNIANIGRDQSGRIGDLLGKPLQLGNEATEARLWELGSKRLDPKFAADEASLRTRLINSGIRIGTPAYNREMDVFNQSKNDARNSLLLTGRGQANTELMAERNAPINEISALLSGSQVSSPSFVNTPQTPVAGTNYAGIVQDSYNNQVKNWQFQQAQDQAAMGGLFSLAGSIPQTVAMAKFSDRRLKSDVERIGTTALGLPLYEYTIFGQRQRGVMADEVLQVMPDAVSTHPSGFKMVRYDMLGLA